MTLSLEMAEQDEQSEGQMLKTLRLRLGGKVRTQVGFPAKVPHGQIKQISPIPGLCVRSVPDLREGTQRGCNHRPSDVQGTFEAEWLVSTLQPSGVHICRMFQRGLLGL